jgi:hypothetical protein
MDDDPGISEYLCARRAEGQASYAEHAAASAGAYDGQPASMRWQDFAEGMNAWLALASSAAPARDEVRPQRAWAWLRSGLRLAADEVRFDTAQRQLWVQDTAAAANIDGAVAEHARVRRALGVEGLSVAVAFAALRPVLAETTAPTVVRWMGLEERALHKLAARGLARCRIVWTSLFTPQLVWSTTQEGGPLVVVQASSGGYIVDQPPSLLRVAWIEHDGVRQARDMTVRMASMLLAG